MDESGKPEPPDLPAYVTDPIERQSPEQLETIAAYAEALADWKRAQRGADMAATRAAEAVDQGAIDDLEERGVETDPDAYEDVPSKAHNQGDQDRLSLLLLAVARGRRLGERVYWARHITERFIDSMRVKRRRSGV